MRPDGNGYFSQRKHGLKSVNNSKAKQEEALMKTRMFISLIVFATTAVIPMAAQSTKTPQTKLEPTKVVAAPPESPEHRFARSQYEVAKHEFEESQKDYNEKLQQDTRVAYDGTRRCKPAPEVLFKHPVTPDSVKELMVGCIYERHGPDS
jgi:hypothetical protein